MKNQKAFDIYTIGHFLMGLIATFILLPIVIWFNSFIKIEIGFITAIGVFIMAVGWEYLENDFLKPREIFHLKYIIDSWKNCITDVVFVMLGMVPILILFKMLGLF